MDVNAFTKYLNSVRSKTVNSSPFSPLNLQSCSVPLSFQLGNHREAARCRPRRHRPPRRTAVGVSRAVRGSVEDSARLPRNPSAPGASSSPPGLAGLTSARKFPSSSSEPRLTDSVQGHQTLALGPRRRGLAWLPGRGPAPRPITAGQPRGPRPGRSVAHAQLELAGLRLRLCAGSGLFQ